MSKWAAAAAVSRVSSGKAAANRQILSPTPTVIPFHTRQCQLNTQGSSQKTGVWKNLRFPARQQGVHNFTTKPFSTNRNHY